MDSVSAFCLCVLLVERLCKIVVVPVPHPAILQPIEKRKVSKGNLLTERREETLLSRMERGSSELVVRVGDWRGC